MKVLTSALAATSVSLVLLSCTTGEAEPSKGTYSLQFPSTAAAVATESVQVLVFEVKTPEERAGICQDLIIARRTRPESLEPVVPPPASANVCEMLLGRRPVIVPYGEHALLAIAQRQDERGELRDFLIGCAVMTIGDGDPPLPIALKLVSVNAPIPPTNCATVGDYCASKCD